MARALLALPSIGQDELMASTEIRGRALRLRRRIAGEMANQNVGIENALISGMGFASATPSL